MSEVKKTAPILPTPVWSGLQKLAIVGAASLKGKELKEVIEERNFPASEVRLLDDEESHGVLEAVHDEATFIQAVSRASFDEIDLVFFACDESFTQRYWKAAKAAGCAIVDLSYGLESEQKLPVRSPWVEYDLEPPMTGAPKLDLETTAVVVAHPAATMLALLMHRVQQAGAIQRSVATVFDPVSELGKRGMDELHQQTLNLLSFQTMPKEVFDIQIAFNMLSRYGEESKASLETVADRISRHFDRVVQGKLPTPALQLLQAPTFHGYTMSVFLETEKSLEMEAITEALKGDHVTLVGEDEDAPNNVNSAGQDSILVSVRPDKLFANGFWLWAAADNLKVSAINAVECASMLVAARPSGKIQ
jgi:aspartate-semialdehyde dehydrogenase